MSMDANLGAIARQGLPAEHPAHEDFGLTRHAERERAAPRLAAATLDSSGLATPSLAGLPVATPSLVNEPAVELPDLAEQLRPSAVPSTHGARVLRQTFIAVDILAAAAACAAVATVAGLDRTGTVRLAMAAAPAWVLAMWALGMYNADRLRAWASGIPEIRGLGVAALVMSWPLYAVNVSGGAAHPVLGALLSASACATLAAGLRAAARAWVHGLPGLAERTLIVGSGTVASDLARRLRQHPEFGLEPIGMVDDALGMAAPDDLPLLGRLADIEDILRRGEVDRVVIAFTRARNEDLLNCLRACRDASVPAAVVPRLFDFLHGAHMRQVGGLPVLTVHAARLTRASAAMKRVLDVAGAALAVLVLAPVMLVAAIAIKLESRGPVLYLQTRAGRGGATFTLLKFRSMHVGAAPRTTDAGIIVKGGEDMRITRVGRLLRRLSIDEMPQLFNVLAGHMSLVGPRPLVLSEWSALQESWHRRRNDLRPGLTGPWQILGRSDITFDEMVRLDFQYVAGWSLVRDLEILLGTIPAVLSGRGAR